MNFSEMKHILEANQGKILYLNDFFRLIEFDISNEFIPKLTFSILKFQVDENDNLIISCKANNSKIEIIISGEKDPYFSLSYLSQNKKGILHVRDITGLLSHEDSYPVFLKKLMNSSLSELLISISPSQKGLSFLANGTLFHLPGQIVFQTFQHEGTQKFIFSLQSSIAPKTLPVLLEDHLGIALDQNIKSLLPSFEFALRELSFDQPNRTFNFRGLFCKTGLYEVESVITISMHPELEIELYFRCEKAPPTFNNLSKDLLLPIEQLKKPGIIPGKVIDKIGETTFYYLGFYFDAKDKKLRLEGTADIFGEIPVSISLYLNHKDSIFTFDADVYQGTFSLNDFMTIIGLEIPPGLPKIELSLYGIHFRENREFNIKGGVSLEVIHPIGKISLDPIDLTINPSTGYFKLINTLESSIPIPVGEESPEVSLNLDIEKNKEKTEGKINGKFLYKSIEFSFNIDINTAAVFTATAKNLELSKIVKKLMGLSLPEEVPDLVIENLTFKADSDKNIHINGKISADKNVVTIGGKTLSLALLKFDFKREKKAGTKNEFNTFAFINLSGKPGIELTENFKCSTFDISFKYDSGQKSWELKGDIDVTVFEKNITLAASYVKEREVQRFQLKTNISHERGPVYKNTFADIKGIGRARSPKVREYLIKKGYLYGSDAGAGKKYRLTDKFKPFEEGFKLKGKYAKYSDDIIDRLLTAKPLVTIPNMLQIGEAENVADLDIKEVALSIEKRGGTSWEFSATGDFNVYDLCYRKKPLFRLRHGKVKVFDDKETNEKGFVFEAVKAEVVLELYKYGPQKALAIKPGFKKFSILKKGKEWDIQGFIYVDFEGVPEPLDQVLAKHIEGRFLVSKQGMELGISRLSAPVKLDFTALQQIGVPFDLGTGIVDLRDITLKVGKDISLSGDLVIGLPSRLNNVLFGEFEKDGKMLTNVDFFKTYYKPLDPENEQEKRKENQSLLRLTFSIGTDGVKGVLSSSPVQVVEIRDYKNKKWIFIDLCNKEYLDEKGCIKEEYIGKAEDYGQIRIQMPEFAFNPQTNSFSASGGYEIDKKRGIKIPLLPVTLLLDLLNLEDLSAVIPTAVPVKTVKLVKEKAGGRRTFDLDGFHKVFKAVGLEIPHVFLEAIKLFETAVLDALPDRFVEYMQINVPLALDFRMDITADGGVSFTLAVDKEGDPLQFLIPTGLQLMGVRLYKLSFGLALGGALLTLEIDGEFDTFDLVGLAGSLLLNLVDENIRRYLPEGRKFHNTFIMRDVIIYVILATQVPIPIPLFYDNLEFSYGGLDGFEFRAAASLPKPVFSVKALFGKFNDIKNFLTKELTPVYIDGKIDREKLIKEKVLLDDGQYGVKLSERKKKTELDTSLGIGPLFLRLPRYLGAKKQTVYELTYHAVETLRKQNVEENVLTRIDTVKNRRFLTRLAFKETVRPLVIDALGTKETGEKPDDKVTQITTRVVTAARNDNIYLGKLIGLDRRHRLPSIWEIINTTLNSIKIPSINYLIQSLHIDDRIGNIDLNLFEIFNIYVVWALTTPKEFADVAYEKLKGRYNELSREPGSKYPVLKKDSPADELLELLADNDTGEVITERDEGLCLFLRGGLDIGKGAVVLESAFGLMAGGISGFRTGVSFRGYIVDIIDAKLLGFIKISPRSKSEPFKLLGKSSLELFNREIMAGLFELTTGAKGHLLVAGKLDLFPEDWPIQLKGHIFGFIDKNQFHLDAGASFELGALKASADVLMHTDRKVSMFDLDIRFLNSQLQLGYNAEKNKQGGASIELYAHINAVSLIEFSSNLNITFGLQSGIILSGHSLLTVGIPSLSILRIETQLDGAFNPRAGFLGVKACLKDGSYLLTPSCKITGGFAFYSWFSGGNAGDFVFTIGGYHPDFNPPVHYPAVPRVGIDWRINENTSVTGEAYFALTPACIMTGGKLCFNYHWGTLRAWFNAYADFIVQWKPFYFSGRVGVSVGVSFKTFLGTLKFELGADLALWGPPIGGRVDVRLWIISFSIHFGQEPALSDRGLSWGQFKELLPTENDVCRIKAEDGLQTTKKINGKHIWIVRPDEFRFSTASAIPSSTLKLGRKTVGKNSKIALRPMKRTGIESTHTIELLKDGKSVKTGGWKVEQIKENMPDALWGDHRNTSINRESLQNQAAGVIVQPPRPDPEKQYSKTVNIINQYDISEEQLPFSPGTTPGDPFLPRGVTGVEKIVDSVNHPSVKANRDSIYNTLTALTGADGSTLFTGSNEKISWAKGSDQPLFAGSPMLSGDAS